MSGALYNAVRGKVPAIRSKLANYADEATVLFQVQPNITV